MSTDPVQRLRAICLALPEATEKEAWGGPTFRVRDRIFAMPKEGHRLALHGRRVGGEESGIGRLVDRPGGPRQHDLRRLRFVGVEVMAVQLEKEDAEQKTRALVAVDERMIADDRSRVERRELDDAGRLVLGGPLSRPGQGRFQQGPVTHTGRAAMQRQESLVQGQRLRQLDPDQRGLTWPGHAACCGSARRFPRPSPSSPRSRGRTG